MDKPLFEKVLVANRGEIALRIMKTLRKMGITSVAIYSEADTNSEHVQYADEAYYIGNSPATESYLSIKNIVSAIRVSGATAVHPGYGFLAENANFANSLKREGITLIGPSAKVIKQMGDKIEAKKIAIESGVTTVPGYMGIIHSPEQAIEIAQGIGFPVIIKAAAGGGGRGMRVVNNEKEMEKAYASAKLEAENCFSDGRVFIEKLIKAPRHIEIQLLSDQFGNAVCLGERECSIQRYHQKVIEEAPSSFVDEVTRRKMYAEVVALSKKVGYYSAGTVEFMMDSNKNYYFLEMNTRLQVEHPVTELITGVDLVEQMIRVAAGEKLSFTQDDIKLDGWAFESRICAEDPSRGFLPSSGRILEYKEPPKSTNVRVDSGIGAGGEVSMYYDAMIAKLCTYAKTREEAINFMKKSLSSFVIKGISHNISFLEAIIHNQRFIDGDINTGFIEQEYPDGFSGANLTSEINEVFVSTAIFAFLTEQKRAASLPNQMSDQSAKIGTRWVISIDDTQYQVMIKQIEGGYNIRLGSSRITISSNWNIGSPLITANINGAKFNIQIERISTGYNLTCSGISVAAYVRSPRMSELESLMLTRDEDDDQNELPAPLSGQIVNICVSVGDLVVPGQELVVLTAMKMENIITAQKEAKVAKILVAPQQNVSGGQVLIEFE
ncbi:MAG: acetyl/propionyl/methylcrotonyl-CoA carboxylase subunit alpha [Rickettsiales bacterium]|nr:acetyl/propionyl/methylcrotonyl-CoA carboxylase subunit alpha [Rickettsiales bacterium]MCA0254112.1 acetyl/propionyl/methylcrotonyl-CoA carboxylase subunit alpha [Pseudomonadota bacterium]